MSSGRTISWMFCFLPLNDIMMLVLTCCKTLTTQWCTKWATFSAICGRLNSSQSYLRWNKPQEMLNTKHSLASVATFSMFPIKLLLITAAEMSMPDAQRCWQDIPCFWRTGMFYPFPITHVDSLILNWKYTLKSQDTHRLQKFQNISKWKKHLTAWISVSRIRVCCVAFAQVVAHHGMLWVLIVYSVSINCNTPPSVRQGEHSSLCPSPPRTQKVSWTLAQINVTSVPAGVVSGSTGRRGQARLCPTGAACGSVS